MATLLLATVLPMSSAGATTVHLRAHAVAASFKVGTALQITGSVTPASSTGVALQRLVGRTWVTLAHAKPSVRGTFTITVKAPSKPATWNVRVVRPKTRSVRAVTGAVFRVRAVKTAYSVSASGSAMVVAGAPVVVTGKVSPRATGTVLLQTVRGTTWYAVTSTKLTHASTYRLSALLPVGPHRVRVVKAATTRVAQGTAHAFGVTVEAPPVAPLQVSTTSLSQGTVGQPFTQTLAAIGGTPPYRWAVAAGTLPVGLALAPTGVLSGVPLLPSSGNLAVQVTDAVGRTSTAVLSVVVSPSPVAAHVLHAWGSNVFGQVGDATTTQRAAPAVVGLTGVVAVIGGTSTSYALRSDGTVWGWGANGTLQLATNAVSSTSVPRQLAGLTAVTAIAGGDGSGYAVKSDGTVWAWGNNDVGQLGDSSDVPSATPVQVSNLTGVTAVAANEKSVYALKSDGTVWAWGKSNFGSLGDNGHSDSDHPVQVVGLTNAVGIAAGYANGYAVLATGSVMSWGWNQFGQLGTGEMTVSELAPVPVPGLTDVRQVASGYLSAYVRLGDGTVRSWGYNVDGELGDGTPAMNRTTPVAVNGLAAVTAISSAGGTAYALRSDGSVAAWGYGGEGERGDGSVTSASTAVSVPGLNPVIAIGAGYDTGYAVTAF